MGGSLMQLVAVGAQDVPLIGNPQMTYFKTVYKRHTNFAMESISLPFNENVDFNKKVSCLIARKGDLVTNMMIELKLPSLATGISWVNGIGHSIIEKIELEIGGHLVDTIYGEFLDIWTELTIPEEKINGYYQMIGKHNNYTRYSQDTDALTLYIPIPFWFCQDIGRSLPLIAMQYHDVKVNVFIRPYSQLWYSGTSMSSIPNNVQITNASIYCDYIFLDTKERKYFATKNHTYLIEQHQRCGGNPVLSLSPSSRAEIDFNLPVKELIWVYQANSVSSTNDWLNYSNTLDDDQDPQDPVEPITKVEFRINGYDRFEIRDGSYFRLVQPFQHHTRIPDKYIYSYSFSIKPENAQPSGTMDFSWINSAEFTFTHPSTILNGNVNVYAINYNYLQITKGMANLVYQS